MVVVRSWAIFPAILVVACGVSEGGEAPRFTGFKNPAAVYCTDVMGYEFSVVRRGDGQQGVCRMPDGRLCDSWGFLIGRCGGEHSLCGRLGYGIETRSDGTDPLTREYGVCVDARGEGVGAVSLLADLDDRSFGCEQWAPPPRNDLTEPVGAAPGRTPPGSFDWRDHEGGDWMTPVKNQGSCGSCWGFCAVGVVEAAHNIAAGDPTLDPDLSEEYLVSDCLEYNDCCGGWHGSALSYIRDSGIPDEACLPYSYSCSCSNGCDDNCTYSSSATCSDHECSDRCGDWPTRLRSIVSTRYEGSDPQAIKQAVVDRGPVAVAVGIGGGVGGGFDGDVYRCSNDDAVNHGVVIVGYDDADGYWIVRNSWGSSWNGNGYYNVGYGECAIESSVYEGFGVATPGDVNADGAFDAADLADLIHALKDGAYVPAGHPDCDGDGTVGAEDLLCVLGVIY